MLRIFTFPIEAVTVDDVSELVEKAWPEGHEVEFKRGLSEKKGREHAWLRGPTDIGEHARDEILSEVVAFANAHGGTLVLGIDQTNEKPPRAAAIRPIPWIGELATRLEDQARTCIDPPLRRIDIRAIETDGQGGGVLIIRTVPSLAAPHRLKSSCESFVRRGEGTVRMTMREIQDMTLNVARGMAGIDASFARRQESYLRWGTMQAARSAGILMPFRVTAMPLVQLPDPGRILDRSDLFVWQKSFDATIESQGRTQAQELSLLVDGGRERPVVRGAARTYEDPGLGVRLVQELYQSGLSDIWFGSAGNTNVIYVARILAAVALTLKIITAFRAAVGALGSEYALEVAIGRLRGSPIRLVGPLMNPDAASPIISDTEMVLPRMSVGDQSDFQRVLRDVMADCHDAAGVRYGQQPTLNVVI